MEKALLENAKQTLDRVREVKPLVHNITNYVTVNDCANVLLGAGASPVMADDAGEVEEIVAISSALVINIGTLNPRTIEAMLIAGKRANQLGVPVILDPVGAGASNLRTETAQRLVREVKFAVIRGNVSEIKTLTGAGGETRGVDAADSDAVSGNNLHSVKQTAASLAAALGTVVAITGAVDVISDGKSSCFIENGHPMMANVTGTGCMCTALIGACCGVSDDHFTAAAAAVMQMGLAGERAHTRLQDGQKGNATYRNYILDEICLMDGAALAEGGRVKLA